MTLFRIALKFAFSKKNSQRTTTIMIIIGIAVSMASLLIIGSVVDALQKQQTNALRNFESFDLILETDLSLDEIKTLDGVDSCFEFGEVYGVLSNDSISSSLRFRALDLDSYLNDNRIIDNLEFISLSENPDFVPSFNFYTQNFLSKNNEASLTFLKKGKTATLVPFRTELYIGGIFKCNEPTFNSTTCFMSLNKYKELFGNENLKIGVFSNDIKKAVVSVHNADPKAKTVSWKEYHKAVYSALLLEKILIYVFLAFMFLILCTNLKNSTSRLLEYRKKDGAILRAMGMRRNSIVYVFIIQGLFLSCIGLILGSLLGFLVICILSDNLEMVLFGIEFSPFLAIYTSLAVMFVSFLSLRGSCRCLYKKEILEVFSNELN